MARTKKSSHGRFRRPRKTKGRKTIKTRKTIRRRNKYIGGDNDIIDLDKGYDDAMIKQMAREPVCIIRPPNKSNMVAPVNIEPPQFLPQKQVGGGGTKIDWVMDFTDDLVEQFKLANGFSDDQTKSLSIFNPSVTWLMDSGNASYYCCTSRCIYYTARGGAPVTADFVKQSYSAMVRRMKFYAIDNYPDADDKYVKYPGSMFNKWISTGGFWASPEGTNRSDVTMVTIIKRQGHSFNCLQSWMLDACINGRVSSGPIDARVINIFNQVTGQTDIVNTVYITGSRSGECVNPGALSVTMPLIAKKHNIIDPGAPVGPWNGPGFEADNGWKQSLTRAQVLKRVNSDTFALAFPYQPRGIAPRNPYANPETSTQSSLANCISWAIPKKTEKNYALFYFHYEDPARTFCPRKCMILNYVMASDPTNKNRTGGMVFYYKQFDASTSNTGGINSVLDGAEFESERDTSWRTLQPLGSDIFKKIEAYFTPLCGLKVSCTTPFVEKDGSLIAVGHIKTDIFMYLNERLKEAIPFFGEDYDTIMRYYNGDPVDGQRQIPKDHLFNYGLDLIKWSHDNIMNDPTHGINGDKKYIVNVKQLFDIPYPGTKDIQHKTYTFISDGDPLRKFLISLGFIQPPPAQTTFAFERQQPSYDAIRNLHPTTVYFMFFYKIDKNTLALESFSHPFMILKDETTSFLNFPMGFTTNQVKNASGQDDGEKHYWVSYGEGDCQSKIAAFTSSQLDALVSQNDNNTPVTNIEFWSYKDGDIS
jgi:hypothetical protein